MRNTIKTGVLMMTLMLSSCSVVQQTSEMKNFARCDFRLESMRQLKLGGVNFQDKQSVSDIGFTDLAKIASSIAGGALPMTFNLNVMARNPNPAPAAMNRLDWILLIDDIEMTRGVLTERIEIQPDSFSEFPVFIDFDLMRVLSGKSSEAVINFALNLAGAGGRPTRVKLKAKPSILVGNSLLEYPGYITIRQDF